MPSLNTYGKIDAATMAFYLPVFAISLVLVFRHGIKRDAGWIFLCIFSLSKLFFYLVSQFPPYHNYLQLALSVAP